MPIELGKIPVKRPLPIPPRTLRWGTVTLLLALIFVFITLLLWPEGVSTNSNWFTFCALVLPILVGGAGYALRLRVYENERDRVIWWNQLAQKQYEEDVIIGQQGVSILNTAYITPYGNNKLALALINKIHPLTSHFSFTQQRNVTIANIQPVLADFTEDAYKTRLKQHLIKLLKLLSHDFDMGAEVLSIYIRHDGILDDVQIKKLWLDAVPSCASHCALYVNSNNEGLMWLEDWLDKQDESLVLSVEINLFMEPRDNQAESVSAVLMASSQWLRNHTEIAPIAVVHRPVIITASIESIETTAKWGGFSTNTPFVLWRNNISTVDLTDQLRLMDESGYLHGLENEHVLEDIFGCPGMAAGNILLICAGENAAATALPQWVISGNNTRHQLIVNPVD
nr:hypothetical protein [uncultured Enterobacter sp.]